MKLDENRTFRAYRPHVASYPSLPKLLSLPLSNLVIRGLPAGGDRFLACAPGRLDVMGGFSEYTGALVLSIPLGEHACVAVGRRNDGLLSIVVAGGAERNGNAPFQAPLDRFRAEGGWVSPDSVAVKANHGDLIRCVLGALMESFRSGLFFGLSAGVSVAVGSTLESIHGAGRHAAVASAMIAAAAGLTDEQVDPFQAAEICERVENQWLGVPAGPSDAFCALMGEADVLAQFRCDNRASCGSVPLPNHVRLIGVDSGISNDKAAAKYHHVRTASFMGRLLIDRIVRHDKLLDGQWDGFLSRVSVNDFVKCFRDRLPMKMTGKDFLDRFGETGDPLTRIDPASAYKIRSRTEHHVYEHSRSRSFAEAIARAIRNEDHDALRAAGGAMNASHWSCGQRCGLGSTYSNKLASLLLSQGERRGILGARTASRGCGGMVTVLLEAGEESERALAAALKAYNQETGLQARVLNGSLSGALVQGAVRV